MNRNNNKIWEIFYFIWLIIFWCGSRQDFALDFVDFLCDFVPWKSLRPSDFLDISVHFSWISANFFMMFFFWQINTIYFQLHHSKLFTFFIIVSIMNINLILLISHWYIINYKRVYMCVCELVSSTWECKSIYIQCHLCTFVKYAHVSASTKFLFLRFQIYIWSTLHKLDPNSRLS